MEFVIKLGIGVVATLVGGFFFAMGLASARLRRLVQRMPTSRIRQLITGDFVELRGKVACDQPLTAPVAGSPCVYYDYKFQRIRHKAGSGSKTSETTYQTIDSQQRRVAFRIADGTGSIEVDPDRAKFDAPLIVDRPVQPGEEIPGGRENPTRPMQETREGKLVKDLGEKIVHAMGGELKPVIVTKNPHRFQVRAVSTDEEVYVLGTVQPGPDRKLRIVKGRSRFFISTQSEEQLLKKLRSHVLAGCLVGPLFLAVGALMLTLGVRSLG